MSFKLLALWKQTAMTRPILSLLLFIAVSSQVIAQTKTASASNAGNVFIELGGNGGILSFNYDMRFNKKGKGLGARIGIGFVPGFDVDIASSSTILMIPFGINYLVGKDGPHYLEAGLGATHASGSFQLFGSSERADGFIFVPDVGYRFQPKEKGFTGRVFISPLIGSGGAFFWGGISGGIKF